MRKTVTFEQPLNERIRTFLRLEFLFNQASHFVHGSSIWNSHAALNSIVEILVLLGRSDIKTEVLKELERHTANLARLEQNPDVDRDRLMEVLDQLDGLTDHLHATSQPIGAELKQNEFLSSLRQRLSLPGGTCDFDLPGYHYWLHQSSEHRMRDLDAWLGSFGVLRQAVEVILQLIREASPPRREIAEGGFYQQSLDPNLSCQLLRVTISADSPYFPEISGGKHRFSVRFLEQPSLEERAQQTKDDVVFALTCCII